MIRLSGIFTLIPATMFLAISFFMLFAVGKADTEGLKKFGRFVAGLLWVCAGLILLIGLYILITGNHPLIAVIRGIGKTLSRANLES